MHDQIESDERERGVDIIGLSLLFMLLMGFILMVTCLVSIFLVVEIYKQKKAPRKISYGVLGLLLTHWVFFLVGGYALFPVNIADAIFLPVWLIISLAGACITIYEMKNFRLFAITMAGLTVISLLFSLFINGIGKM